MKKLMIIAVIISGMLMPAQVFAKNDRNERKGEKRVQMDYDRSRKGGNGKEIKIGKGHSHAGNKHIAVKPHKPAPVVHHHAPVVHHHVPVVHHHAPVVHHYNHEVAQAAAVAVGIAGLISILAH